MKKLILGVFGVCSILLFSNTIYATEVVILFQGQITSADADVPLSPGTSFSALLKYDTEGYFRSYDGDYRTDYSFPNPPSPSTFTLDVNVGTYHGSAPSGTMTIINDSPNVSPTPTRYEDWFQAWASEPYGFTGDSIGGLTWKQTDITLKDLSGSVFTDTSLPEELPDLSEFAYAFAYLWFTDGATTKSAYATITSMTVYPPQIIEFNSPYKSSGVIPFGDNDFSTTYDYVRYQQIYNANQFPGPLLISQISFFRDPDKPGSLLTGTFTLKLSTSEQSLDSMDWADLDQNVGEDEAVFTTVDLGGAAPLILTFTGEPFYYNPSLGNLLLDIDYPDTSYTYPEAFFLGFSSVGVPIVSRAYYEGPGYGLPGYGLVTLIGGFSISDMDGDGILNDLDK